MIPGPLHTKIIYITSAFALLLILLLVVLSSGLPLYPCLAANRRTRRTFPLRGTVTVTVTTTNTPIVQTSPTLTAIAQGTPAAQPTLTGTPPAKGATVVDSSGDCNIRQAQRRQQR